MCNCVQNGATLKDAAQIRKRFEALFGDEKLAEKLAMLTGTNRATVFRWYERGFPEMAILTLELLERCPADEWPERAKAAKLLK